MRVARIGTSIQTVTGWLAVGVCCLFAAYALSVGIAALLSVLGLWSAPEPRAVPPLFALHALTGATALVAGAVQLRIGRPRSAYRRRLHRRVGYAYVGATCATCGFGVVVAMRFDVGSAATFMFSTWAAAWFATTVYAARLARARLVATHRQWMSRSYALALVFISFEPFRTGLLSVGWEPETAYPLAIGLNIVINLGVAEIWHRRKRAHPTRRLPEARVETGDGLLP